MNTAMARPQIDEERLLTDRLYQKKPFLSENHNAQFPTISSGSSQSLSINCRDCRIIIDYWPGNWFLPLVENICELTTLAPNWNGYGAEPIRTEAAVAGILILLSIMQSTDPHPSIVPTSGGGILLEWHRNGIDLEVDVQSLSRVHLVYENGDIQTELHEASIESVAEKYQSLRRLNA